MQWEGIDDRRIEFSKTVQRGRSPEFYMISGDIPGYRVFLWVYGIGNTRIKDVYPVKKKAGASRLEGIGVKHFMPIFFAEHTPFQELIYSVFT